MSPNPNIKAKTQEPGSFLVRPRLLDMGLLICTLEIHNGTTVVTQPRLWSTTPANTAKHLLSPAPTDSLSSPFGTFFLLRDLSRIIGKKGINHGEQKRWPVWSGAGHLLEWSEVSQLFSLPLIAQGPVCLSLMHLSLCHPCPCRTLHRHSSLLSRKPPSRASWGVGLGSSWSEFKTGLIQWPQWLLACCQ